ncbi:MAG: hypothetical protein K9N51_12875 [Candidatus Pacebacteria bacterium]|nr:hypothetical protein [Candidatus Paceibacterota bacterium]
MAQELIYTSARKGLKPGTSGFCTVAHTKGMSSAAIRVAESLSAYKRTGKSAHGTAGEPVIYSHHRCIIQGVSTSILSRVHVSEREHTGRDNKIAHHIVLDPLERPVGGPAWLAAREGLFVEEWVGEARLLNTPKTVPLGDSEFSRASTWEKITGDAGWAGIPAENLIKHPGRLIYLIFEPGMDMLGLIDETLALLSPRTRWGVTFSTYFSHPIAGTSCTWRCCLPDQPLLKDPRTVNAALVLDLTRSLGDPSDTPFVRQARGEMAPKNPVPKAAAPASVEHGEAHASEDTPESDKKPRFVKMPNRHRKYLRMKPERRKGTDAE